MTPAAFASQEPRAVHVDVSTQAILFGAECRWGPLLPLLKSYVRLEIFGSRVILLACRFTSFIAKNADATAKSLSVPAIGKAPSARNADPQSSKRSSPSSLHPMAAVERVPLVKAVVAAAVVAHAQAAGRIGISRVKEV